MSTSRLFISAAFLSFNQLKFTFSLFEHCYPTTWNESLPWPGYELLCVFAPVCSMAAMSLLLEAGACAGSDHMFKGCVRENPLWGEPCAGSMLACWWALLRCCQRHRDNGQSMQNHSRSTDGSGWINDIHTQQHTLAYIGACRLIVANMVTSYWKVKGQSHCLCPGN